MKEKEYYIDTFLDPTDRIKGLKGYQTVTTNVRVPRRVGQEERGHKGL